jgi:elongation factor G
LEPIAVPDPVIHVALEPMNHEGDKLLRQAVQWLRKRDPSLRFRVEAGTGRQLLCGMGELHLEVALEWLRKDRGIALLAAKPQVSYREVPKAPGAGAGLVDLLVAGRGRYAEVTVDLVPTPLGTGVQIRVSERLGAARTWTIAAIAGVRDALQAGPMGGFPVVDVAVEITGLRHHDVDSSEQAFRLAGRLATNRALEDAKTVVTEPTMRVEIVTPEDYMGAVLGDLHSRRGNVLEMVALGRRHSVTASVPLADLRGYATALRSLTQGRATHSMHFENYTPMPGKLTKQLVGRS